MHRQRAVVGGDAELERAANPVAGPGLRRVPGELEDLSRTDPEERERLERELDDWTAALGLPAIDAAPERGAPPELDPAARERLKALGYVE